MPVLEVKSLCFETTVSSPGAGRREIFSGIDLVIERGECVGVFGVSGTGKTTLARCLAGLNVPVSGTITLDGAELFPSPQTTSTNMRRNIQLLFQNHTASLDPLFTVRRSLLEALRNESTTDGPLEGMLRRVGLGATMLDRRTEQLSGGERQRVALARALAVDPSVLILDEPTSALDVLTQAGILNLLTQIKSEKTMGMLFISHDMRGMRTLCDRIFCMEKGSLTQFSSTASAGPDNRQRLE